jgi:hypothetical protein
MPKLSFAFLINSLRQTRPKDVETARGLRRRKNLVTNARANELFEFVGQNFAESELGFKFNEEFRRSTRGKNLKRDLRKFLQDSSKEFFPIGETRPKRSKSLSALVVQPQSTEDEEIDELKKRNSDLESEVRCLRERLSKIETLFGGTRRSTRENGSGSTKVFTSSTNVAILKMLERSVSGQSVSVAFETLAEAMDDCFDAPLQTPSARYCQSMRADFETLALKQIESMVRESESLVLHLDSFVDINGESSLGCGLSNESGDYYAVGFESFIAGERKTGDVLRVKALKVISELEPEPELITSKLCAIQSDSEPAQIKCNALIAESLEKELANLPCSLHGAANVEKKSVACVDKQTQDCLSSAMMLFGSRNGCGYRKYSLKKHLDMRLDRMKPNEKSIFRSSAGCRVMATTSNCRAMLMFEDEVRFVLATTFAATNPYAGKLRRLMASDEWRAVKIQLSFISLCWNVLCRQMFTVLSKPVSCKIHLRFLFYRFF